MVEMVIRCWTAVCARTSRRDERGDVPGWVLITVMTAGLVTVLWAVAGDLLTQMLSDALGSVSS
jgi:hypothetical protein